jgi:Uma2 family endonuclease
MSTAELQTHSTASDLLEMPDSKSFELVDGILVERNLGAVSSWINGRISKLLSNFVDENSLGWVLDSEAGYHCFGENGDTLRRPDVSFVRFGRFSNESLPEGHISIPPDLAVEVVSPHDRVYELQQKLVEYRNAGVRLIWIVNPVDQSVTVYSANSDQPVVIRNGGELNGSDVLPGFQCSTASLFPPATK